MNANKLFIPQDSTGLANPQLSMPQTGGLNLNKNTISLGDLRTIRIDSSRYQKPRKKYIPVKKTIPLIPASDSIEQPVFKASSGKYHFPHKKENPTPDWYNIYEASVKPIKTKVTQDNTTDNELLETIESNPFLTKIEGAQQFKGFKQTDWMLGVIIISLLLFGWIRVVYGRYITSVLKASYNYHTAHRIQEETNTLRKRVYYLMNVLFFIVSPLFITQFFSYHQISIWGLEHIWLYLLVMGSWFLLYSIKAFFLILLDFLFLGKGSFIAYNFTVFIYNKILAFALLPIVSILPFVPANVTTILLNLGLILAIFLYLMRLVRGFQLSFKNRLSVFYLFLYLCALEILPIMVLFKTITMFLH